MYSYIAYAVATHGRWAHTVYGVGGGLSGMVWRVIGALCWPFTHFDHPFLLHRHTPRKWWFGDEGTRLWLGTPTRNVVRGAQRIFLKLYLPCLLWCVEHRAGDDGGWLVGA